MNIVLITTGSREELLHQSVRSLIDNAADISAHTLTVVIDEPSRSSCLPLHDEPGRPTLILNATSQGASASRNIGASSIPKYRRQKFVCFFDDDIFAVANWDKKLLEVADNLHNSIISGHAHPYNGSERYILNPLALDPRPPIYCQIPLVISTVNMLMPWSLWDEVGFFIEPGGAAGGEDVDYCKRAREKGYGLAITEPQCVIHTGLTSSTGKQLIGYDSMVKQNSYLMAKHGISGKVTII